MTIVAITGLDAGTGTLTLNAGVVTYTPPLGFFGTTTFAYTLEDPSGATDTAGVIISVSDGNDPPTANADSFTISEDVTTVFDVLGNDSIAPA